LSNIASNASQYVEQMAALESDRRTRAAFQTLAVSLAPPRGHIFDFGSGPGIDALFFAQRGFKIAAYEIDPSMCAYFAGHCKDFIATGQISLDCRDYATFLSDTPLVARSSADLIVSNFAPLSLVSNLRELFHKFHALTNKTGRVLASVLNPYFIGDMRFPWWWRRIARLRRIGHYVLPSPGGPLTRRRFALIAAECQPHFELVRVFPGTPAGGQAVPEGFDPAHLNAANWLQIARNRFTFLLLQKTG
jgi:SAM-dependent methyltransferase